MYALSWRSRSMSSSRVPPHHVVGQVEDVIGLVVGQVNLQQPQPIVDLLGQTQLGHQAVHRRDPTKAGRVDVGADLVRHRPRPEHRNRPLAPVPGQRVPGRHPLPAACRVPPTLLMRYLHHQKGLTYRDTLAAQ